ncbi:LysR family transcriptional regulator [Sneathiella sp. HT1-7]|uniref:LysR family transcriptional regulator n=1 Tax=Sneathiella sp. HT1-7 TaxID=2887192 RepID=UPI001D15DF02|nr:LysR family transcriptional regulator [Sneathiella sp. HT1-7]MCC3303812.1 LysR family transcriptional regulator [Sneathiella sp. HT1-7]
MMQGFKLIQLQVFSKVIELQTFSAAAEYFGVTQPAITFHVKELEEALGVCLIERPNKSMKSKPTQAGEELLKHVHKIDGAISMMRASMEKYRESVSE